MANPKFTRAWPGGSGANKIGANYATTLYPQVIIILPKNYTTLQLKLYR